MAFHRLPTIVLFGAVVGACAEPKPAARVSASPAPPPCPVCDRVVADAAPPPADCPAPPPRAPALPPDAGAASSLPAWTAAPAGSTTMFFRETYLGMLPRPHRRTTWTLIQSGTTVILRAEDQVAKVPFDHLDRTSTFPDGWTAARRTEYVGVASAASPPFTLTAKRAFGDHEPADLVLKCAPRTIAVHPALATLVEGWKRMDDSMEPASWAPPRTENVVVLACAGPGAPRSFEDGLSFAKAKKETATEPERVGVEWAHVNSDMVIQQGGYRWMTSFSVK